MSLVVHNNINIIKAVRCSSLTKEIITQTYLFTVRSLGARFPTNPTFQQAYNIHCIELSPIDCSRKQCLDLHQWVSIRWHSIFSNLWEMCTVVGLMWVKLSTNTYSATFCPCTWNRKNENITSQNNTYSWTTQIMENIKNIYQLLGL